MGIIELISVGLGSSVLTAIISALVNRKKVVAEADTMIIQKFIDWGSALTTRIQSLEAKLEECNRIINNQTLEIAALRMEISRLTSSTSTTP